MLSIIAAVAKNGVIGRDNSLIWKLPADLKRVKEITLTGSRTLIMGRKTFEGLPGVLPGRQHIVLTENRGYSVENENVKIAHSLEDLKEYIESPEEYFVFGGGRIYSLLLPYTEKIYLTKVDENFEGDTSFPRLDMEEWRVLEELAGEVNDENPLRHSFLILVRS